MTLTPPSLAPEISAEPGAFSSSTDSLTVASVTATTSPTPATPRLVALPDVPDESPAYEPSPEEIAFAAVPFAEIAAAATESAASSAESGLGSRSTAGVASGPNLQRWTAPTAGAATVPSPARPPLPPLAGRRVYPVTMADGAPAASGTGTTPVYRFPIATVHEIAAHKDCWRQVLLSEGDRACWYAGSLGFVLGGGGIGKSRWSLGLAIASILGREYCGFRTHDVGQWLFLNTENNVFRASDDLNQFMDGWRLTPAERDTLNARLLINASTPELTTPPTDLSDPYTVDALRTLAVEHAPAVVVVDPWESFVMGGDANDATTTRRSLDRLQAIFPNSTLLVLHHSREGAEATKGAFGFNATAFSKGSKTAITKARFVINLTARHSNTEADSKHGLVISCGKSNDTARFAVRAVEVGEDGLYHIDTRFNLNEYLAEVEGRRKASLTTAAIVAAVRDGLTTGTELVAYFAEQDVPRSTFYRVLGNALEQGVLKKNRRGIYSVRSGSADGEASTGDDES